MEKIRVALVDRQVIFRQGMRAGLAKKEDIDVVAEADLNEEALPLIEAFSPNIVILDAGLPGLDGLELARRISQHSPGVSVIVLSAYESSDHLFQAIKAGASAFVTKNIAAEELVSIIRRVADGEQPINETVMATPDVASLVLKRFQELSLVAQNMEALVAPLSRRETEILSHVAAGSGNRQIALALGISEQTVKNHVTSILRKLAANDRTHAVVLALRNGWLSLPPEH